MAPPIDPNRPQRPLAGALWMIAAGFGFTALAIAIRKANAEVHIFEVVFFRNFFSLVFMVPVLWRVGFGHLRTRRPFTHLARGTSSLVSMMFVFQGLALLPLAESTALTFTAPLFATAGAAIFLREEVRLRRWAAVIVGFAGMLIILRPGVAAVSAPALYILFGSIFVATTSLLVKSLARTEHPDAIVFYMALIVTPLSLVPALFVWQWPTLHTFGWLALLGAVATAGHMCMTRAFASADASAVFPFDYGRLITAAIVAFLLFGEVPDGWTWVGGAVIAGAGIYISQREARVARAERLRTSQAVIEDRV